MTTWIDIALVQAFAAEQTDAYRLCTFDDGWAERFGGDILISYKTAEAQERLKTELYLWSLAVNFKFSRIFARFLPKLNSERDVPKLVIGDAGSNLQTTDRRAHV